jgi:hypothetical protein
MKRKPNPQKADRENPTWTKETFARARSRFSCLTGSRVRRNVVRVPCLRQKHCASVRTPSLSQCLRQPRVRMASANLRKVKLSRIIIIENCAELRHSLNLRPQCGYFLGHQLKHKVVRKSCKVSLDLFVKSFGLGAMRGYVRLRRDTSVYEVPGSPGARVLTIAERLPVTSVELLQHG